MTLRRIRHAAIGLALLLSPVGASAQELEPGAYWPLPRGFNIITVVDSFNAGDVAFEPSAPIDEASAKINTTAIAFARTFGFFGRSANASVLLPVVAGHLEGLYLGEPAEVDRFGLADPKVKMAVNLYGAPSMAPKDVATYRMRTIVGVSLAVLPPLGQYDSAKLINIGNNRWSFKPELGVARTFGRWVVEGMAGVWLFTDNTEFLGGTYARAGSDRRASTASDLSFPGRDVAGRRRQLLPGRPDDDRREGESGLPENSRVGATFSKGLKRGHAIRASFSRGAYTTLGADFTSVAVAYNYAWVN